VGETKGYLNTTCHLVCLSKHLFSAKTPSLILKLAFNVKHWRRGCRTHREAGDLLICIWILQIYVKTVVNSKGTLIIAMSRTVTLITVNQYYYPQICIKLLIYQLLFYWPLKSILLFILVTFVYPILNATMSMSLLYTQQIDACDVNYV
jgi:hypothetical protein